MSAPILLGQVESGDSTECKKDRIQNKVIQIPSDACTGERQGGEQSKIARLGVHSRSRLKRGSDQAAPLLGRELTALNRIMLPRGGTAGHLSGSDRATRCPTGETRRGALCPIIRPSPVGGVNELVKYTDIDAR